MLCQIWMIRVISSTVLDMETKDFEELLEYVGMTEVKANGRKYTWANNHTYSRIQKVIANVY